MKKVTITIARTDEAGGPFEVSGYQTDTPGLAAWNRPNLAYTWKSTDGEEHSKRIHQTWALIHQPTGKHVAAARLRSEIEVIAAALAPVTDWTQKKIGLVELTEAAHIIRENDGSL